MKSSRIDRILKKLLTAETLPRDTHIKIDTADLIYLCKECIKTLQNDPVLLRLDAPLVVLGDIHGQYYDLLKYFKMGGELPKTNYLMLGDYVDRGKNSVEVFSLLMCFKIKYPNNFWMIRGNHETREISRMYGFYNECCQHYTADIWNKFCDVFEWLPIGAVISERIFCVHGGLSQELSNLSQIEELTRPIRIPEQGLLTDLIWADPSNDHVGYQPSQRGTSYSFGYDIADRFLQKNDFDLVCRAHQVVEKGYEFPFLPKYTVITVFSAPDYCEEFGNKGAMMKVDKELRCTFEFIDPPKRKTGRRLVSPYSNAYVY